MENPNIHNIPYVRSRDQKRWKGHSKKVISKEETTERYYTMIKRPSIKDRLLISDLFQ